MNSGSLRGIRTLPLLCENFLCELPRPLALSLPTPLKYRCTSDFFCKKNFPLKTNGTKEGFLHFRNANANKSINKKLSYC